MSARERSDAERARPGQAPRLRTRPARDEESSGDESSGSASSSSGASSSGASAGSSGSSSSGGGSSDSSASSSSGNENEPAKAPSKPRLAATRAVDVMVDQGSSQSEAEDEEPAPRKAAPRKEEEVVEVVAVEEGEEEGSTRPRRAQRLRAVKRLNYREESEEEEDEEPASGADAADESGESAVEVEVEDEEEEEEGDGDDDGGEDEDEDEDDENALFARRALDLNIPVLPDKTVQMLLASRIAGDAAGSTPGPRVPRERREYLVKYRHRSYRECEWRSFASLLAELGPSMLSLRVTALLKREARGGMPIEESGFHVEPDWSVVERVAAMTEAKPGQRRCLVKWRGLQYSDSTWEPLEFVESTAPEALQRFYEADVEPKPQGVDLVNVSRARFRPKHFVPFSLDGAEKDGEPTRLLPPFRGGRALRPYQLEGLNWLAFNWHQGRNSILADEMGLGKTVQSVAFVRYLIEEMKIQGPYLVVAPLSTLPHWQREFEGWTGIRTLVFHGSELSRKLILKHEWNVFGGREGRRDSLRFQVLITTLEMVRAEFALLSSLRWRSMIIDEAHRLKNGLSQGFLTLEQFPRDHCVFLTGTPIQNNLRELWTLLHFIDHEHFDDWAAFERQYGSMSRSSEVEALHDLLRRYLLRRLKDDVEKSLPAREETLIEVEPTTLQKKYYKSLYEGNFELISQTHSKKNLPALLNVAMQLRKVCNHPYLLRGVEDVDTKDAGDHGEIMQRLVMSSGKLVLLDKLLPKLQRQGHRVLIFSQFKGMLDIIEDFCRFRGFRFERVDGNVRGEQRQQAIDRFSNKDSDSFLFLLSTRAGGVGINLTAADTVIIYDSDWNPQNDIQAQARCHRIGQTRAVHIYRLVTRGTYEMEMFNRASRKLGLDRAVLQSMSRRASDGEQTEKMSSSEIETLLRKGAYHMFLDENSERRSAEFCSEDIDQILEKNSRVLRFGAQGASGGSDAGAATDESKSTFAKASFVPSSEGANVDLNDPEFWSKIGLFKKAASPVKKRTRKEVDRLSLQAPSGSAINVASDDEDAQGDGDSSSGSGDGDGDGDDEAGNNSEDKASGGAAPKEEDADGWSERLFRDFYNALLRFGYGRWRRFYDHGRKGSAKEMQRQQERDAATKGAVGEGVSGGGGGGGGLRPSTLFFSLRAKSEDELWRMGFATVATLLAIDETVSKEKATAAAAAAAAAPAAAGVAKRARKAATAAAAASGLAASYPFLSAMVVPDAARLWTERQAALDAAAPAPAPVRPEFASAADLVAVAPQFAFINAARAAKWQRMARGVLAQLERLAVLRSWVAACQGGQGEELPLATPMERFVLPKGEAKTTGLPAWWEHAHDRELLLHAFDIGWGHSAELVGDARFPSFAVRKLAPPLPAKRGKARGGGNAGGDDDEEGGGAAEEEDGDEEEDAQASGLDEAAATPRDRDAEPFPARPAANRLRALVTRLANAMRREAGPARIAKEKDVSVAPVSASAPIESDAPQTRLPLAPIFRLGAGKATASSSSSSAAAAAAATSGPVVASSSSSSAETTAASAGSNSEATANARPGGVQTLLDMNLSWRPPALFSTATDGPSAGGGSGSGAAAAASATAAATKRECSAIMAALRRWGLPGRVHPTVAALEAASDADLREFVARAGLRPERANAVRAALTLALRLSLGEKDVRSPFAGGKGSDPLTLLPKNSERLLRNLTILAEVSDFFKQPADLRAQRFGRLPSKRACYVAGPCPRWWRLPDFSVQLIHLLHEVGADVHEMFQRARSEPVRYSLFDTVIESYRLHDEALARADKAESVEERTKLRVEAPPKIPLPGITTLFDHAAVVMKWLNSKTLAIAKGNEGDAESPAKRPRVEAHSEVIECVDSDSDSDFESAAAVQPQPQPQPAAAAVAPPRVSSLKHENPRPLLRLPLVVASPSEPLAAATPKSSGGAAVASSPTRVKPVPVQARVTPAAVRSITSFFTQLPRASVAAPESAPAPAPSAAVAPTAPDASEAHAASGPDSDGSESSESEQSDKHRRKERRKHHKHHRHHGKHHKHRKHGKRSRRDSEERDAKRARRSAPAAGGGSAASGAAREAEVVVVDDDDSESSSSGAARSDAVHAKDSPLGKRPRDAHAAPVAQA